MTPARPYMPFYARDWLTDAEVSSMSLAARAVYLDLILTSWLNDGIQGPDGSVERWRALAAMARASQAEIRKVWPSIAPHFQEGPDGKLRNKRAQRLKQELDQHAKTRSESGRRGALARWQTDGKRMAT